MEKAIEVEYFVLRKVLVRGWRQTLRKEKKGKKEELSEEESNDKVIGVELESDSEEEKEEKVYKRGDENKENVLRGQEKKKKR